MSQSGITTTRDHPNGTADEAEARKRWVIAQGARYWPGGEAIIDANTPGTSALAPSGRLVEVALPDEAADLGVGSPPAVLVDAAALTNGEGAAFARCDLIGAAFLHLSGAFERSFEAEHGPINSYAFRLPILSRAHERAWVNRIFLVLRRMTARALGRAEEAVFGPLPEPRIDLSHDVDAITKTVELRVKQGAFHLFNAARALSRAELSAAAGKLANAARFVAGRHDLWTLPRLLQIEECAGVRSTLHVYGGPPGLKRGSPLRVLMDPGYDVAAPKLAALLRRAHADGWTIGLHQAFQSWSRPDAMAREKEAVERAVGAEVTRCRQHWLRFSWQETWAAQAAAGLTFDSTLGFNDRPGFRVGAALTFSPWSPTHNAGMGHRALPMVLMDSQVYDYAVLNDEARRRTLEYWVDEVVAVRGEASFNWHTHTLSPAYGWERGYLELLDIVAARGGGSS